MKNNKYIIEKLKVIYEYDQNYFNYDYAMKDMWNDLLKESMDKFKIRFDLENNESCKIQRTIVIPQNYYKETECKFKCELCCACGDWQTFTNYFKIQIISGYCFNDDFNKKNNLSRSNYKNSFFVFIPNKDQGNEHLVLNDKGNYLVPIGNSDNKGDLKIKPNDKKCWESLNNYLKELVDKEIDNHLDLTKIIN